MDKNIDLIFYCAYEYLSMLGFKLTHASKKVPWSSWRQIFVNTSKYHWNWLETINASNLESMTDISLLSWYLEALNVINLFPTDNIFQPIVTLKVTLNGKISRLIYIFKSRSLPKMYCDKFHGVLLIHNWVNNVWSNALPEPILTKIHEAMWCH